MMIKEAQNLTGHLLNYNYVLIKLKKNEKSKTKFVLFFLFFAQCFLKWKATSNGRK